MRSLAIVLLFSVSFCARAQETGKDILEKAVEQMKLHNSLSYTATLRFKAAQNNDTATHSSMVHMIRDERDTIMGGMVWQSDGIDDPKHYSFYDLDMRYIVMHPQRKVWREKMPDPGYMGLKQHTQHLLYERFLNPGIFLNGTFEDISLLKDTVIDNQPCYVVKTRQSSEFSNIGPAYHTWYFSQKDMFPLMDIYEVKIDDGIQYGERRFLTHEYDNVSPEQFSPKQIPAEYVIDARPPNKVIYRKEK